MLIVGMGLGAAEGASVLRRGSSWSGRPPKIILAGFGFSLGQLASGGWGAILPHWSRQVTTSCVNNCEMACSTQKKGSRYRIPHHTHLHKIKSKLLNTRTDIYAYQSVTRRQCKKSKTLTRRELPRNQAVEQEVVWHYHHKRCHRDWDRH